MGSGDASSLNEVSPRCGFGVRWGCVPGVAPLAIDLGRVAADVEARCGLKRLALSLLENDKTHNPTFLTLQRYATALGLTLRTALANRTG